MRIIAFVLALTLLLSLAGCGEVSVSGNHATSQEGISIEILFAKRTAEDGTVLEVRWNNASDRDILFGSNFGIDRLEGDKWEQLKARPNTAFTTEAYLLRAHTCLERTYRLDWVYDVSKTGSYRLTVEYSFYDENNTNHPLWAEFVIGMEQEVTEPSAEGTVTTEKFTWIRDWETLQKQDGDVLAAAQGYNKKFFRDNDLLLIRLGEGSSSVKHSVTSSEIVDGVLSVWIHKTNPSAMTMDLTHWFVLVPLKKGVEVSDIQLRSGVEVTSKKILQAPPKLEIVYDGGQFEAQKGTYSWHYDTGDGTWSAVMADSAHPLQMKKHLDLVSCGSKQIQLVFEEIPASFTVRCWPKSAFGNTDAISETAQLWNNTLNLNEGGWIYEVTANWNDECYNGTATYVFYMAPAALQ